MPGRLTRIDGLHLRVALRSGVARVRAATGLLNRINVYPVADGDTGTNLAMTLAAVDQALAASASRSAGEVLALAADAAVDGARGNSGAIVAEFLQGLADAAGEQRRLGAARLAAAFASGDRYARGALDAPQEGTILTAISAVAQALAAGARARRPDLRAILPVAVEAARAAVAQTREMLPALRRAGVEDAGARGFLLLMEGVADAALGRPEAATGASEVTVSAAEVRGAGAPHGDVHGGYRYCTECVVSGTGIDRRRLREELGGLGDSLVIAGGREKLRIHIHADDPRAVFALAAAHGSVSHEKADDMGRQARAHRERQRHAVVVTDSGADLPEEILADLGIHTVPLRIHFADRTFLDKAGMTPGEFLQELAASPHPPRTSQPAPGDLRRACEFLASHYEHVIAISLIGRASGTLQAWRMAARRSSSPQRITVLDSHSISVGQGLIAMYAAECARAGLPVPELRAAIERAAATTRLWATVADLGHATRGGRLPRLAAGLAGLLPVLPILCIGGGIRVAGLIRRGGDPVPALLRRVLRHVDPARRYRCAIAHAGCPAPAAALRAALAAAMPHAGPIHITELGPAASVHAGPGALGVAVLEYAPPEARPER